MKPLKLILFLLFCAPLLLTAASTTAFGQQSHTTAPPSQSQTNSVVESYTLGTGDKVRVIVFGQDDLGGEYTVDDSGFVRLPLIGQVKAGGRTVHEFEDDVIAKLADGYLKDPRVSIEVTNFRPFYIIGEVNKPGEYPYVTGMSVLNAVALAGGYTYRANDSDVYIRRRGEQEKEFPANETTLVYPGDIVRVPERIF